MVGARVDGHTFETELEARPTLPSSGPAPGHEQNHDKRSSSDSFGLRLLRFDHSRDNPTRQEAVAGLGCCCGQQRGRLRYRPPDGSIRLCACQSRVHRSLHNQPVPLAVQVRIFRLQACNWATRERPLTAIRKRQQRQPRSGRFRISGGAGRFLMPASSSGRGWKVRAVRLLLLSFGAFR